MLPGPLTCSVAWAATDSGTVPVPTNGATAGPPGCVLG